MPYPSCMGPCSSLKTGDRKCGTENRLHVSCTHPLRMTSGRYQNGCRYQRRYLISADFKAVRGKGSEVATSDHVFLNLTGKTNSSPLLSDGLVWGFANYC